ncbi:MAG: hypothetical protein Q9170_003412 [Blastenia crenularia]
MTSNGSSNGPGGQRTQEPVRPDNNNENAREITALEEIGRPSPAESEPDIPDGAFQTFYQKTLIPAETPSNIAWIGSLQAFLMISLGIVVGPLFDYGYLRTIVISGSGLVVTGMLMTGLCEQYWQLMLAQGVTVGLEASGFGDRNKARVEVLLVCTTLVRDLSTLLTLA